MNSTTITECIIHNQMQKNYYKLNQFQNHFTFLGGNMTFCANMLDYNHVGMDEAIYGQN